MIYWVKKLGSDWPGHGRALYEAGVLFAFSIAPFVITLLVRSAKLPNGASISFGSFFERGQLYLLAYALSGSIVWLAFLKPDKPRHGARAFLGLIGLLVLLPVIALIGVDPTFSTILNRDIIWWSYATYITLLIIRYLLTFYMNIEPPAPSEVFAREGSKMRSQYEELKNG
jgi:hypothetical protein